jgi:hypothetical protein
MEDIGSRDVSGHEIGGALHALKIQSTDTRQRFDRKSFGQTGNAFNDRMAAANEHEQELIDDGLLADDDFGKLRTDLRGKS